MNEIIERHPNPQFARKNIFLLDGEWSISLNGGRIQKIRVPYCPESELSGIGETDFIKDCEYHKTFRLSETMKNGKILLRFGAVNYSARVYINGKYAGSHAGGYTPFCFDITEMLNDGENLIVVCVRNNLAERNPSGKQSPKKESFGCFYTRCTGIWQSVWLEKVPEHYLRAVRFYPNMENNTVTMEMRAEGSEEYKAEIFCGEKLVGTCGGNLNNKGIFIAELNERRLWQLNKGNLYEVRMRFGNDEVYSYFGMREVKYDGYKFLLNGKTVFQRLVLDQGYYPKGVYTPEKAEDFAADIERAKSLGFNGARLHQKVFDPRYLYESDKRGFMLWGEYASWGGDYSELTKFGQFVNEWRETIERDFNHPSIVVWCPLNELWGELDNVAKTRDLRFVEGIYNLTKIFDPSRPCVDVSGGMHGSSTDIADFHCYDSLEIMEEKLRRASYGEMDFLNMYNTDEGFRYSGQPQHLSEFGGIAFSGIEITQTQCVQEQNAWGYNVIENENAFVENYEKTMRQILKCEKLSGCCYTQLYDIEQEQNGLYSFDRTPKFSEPAMWRIRIANMLKAKIEK